MQKVFKDCYELDKRCYEEYGLTEEILMEHAARGMATYIEQNFPIGTSVLVAAGAGNNGGDGIAMSRQIQGEYNVKLYLPFGVKSPMAKLQLQRANAVGVPVVEAIENAEVIVDALFGAGLSRPLDEESQKIVRRLNALSGFKIACDIPTGIDRQGKCSTIAFKADVTLTMGAYKEALYLDEAKDYVGELQRVNLGIAPEYYEGMSENYILEEDDLSLPIRKSQNSHKGSFGHAVLFCGEKEGAGIIAGMVSARFGAGLTSLVIHEKIVFPPFLMHSTVVPDNASALAIGMGLGGYFEQEFLQKYVIDSPLPVVLDADALLSKELLRILEQKEREVVITPHPKEFGIMWQILTGEEISVSEIQSRRFEIVRRFNAKYPHVTLLLKGANTLIAQEEKLYINPLGCNKLSKGGSGDVLSGLIVALLAQGNTGLDAAIQGSLALTLAAEKYRGASYAMLPTDLIDEIARLETI